MSVKERIKIFAKSQEKSVRAFEIKCGLTIGYINAIRTSIQPDKIQSIASHYPTLNTGWLMTGSGEMLLNKILVKPGNEYIPKDELKKKDDPEAKIFTDDQQLPYNLGKSNINDLSDEVITIPLLPISAQGGSLDEFFVSVKGSDCERIISPIRGVDFAITVSGESMSPEYPNGAKILIKKINEKAFLEWGEVYVLDTCNGTVLKTLRDPKKEGCVLCTSINPDPKYAPFIVNTEDILGVYRVMMCMTVK